MYVDIYTKLTVLALLVAPYIYDISRLRVKLIAFFCVLFYFMVPYVIVEIQIIAINIHQTLQQTSQGDEVDYIAYMEIKNSFLPENLK